VIRVKGPSPKDPHAIVEVVIDEAPMRAALIDYSERVLELSIVISLITAALVYLSLQWLMIRPMRRLTEAMVAFRDDPEDLSATILPSRRHRARPGHRPGAGPRPWRRDPAPRQHGRGHEICHRAAPARQPDRLSRRSCAKPGRVLISRPSKPKEPIP